MDETVPFQYCLVNAAAQLLNFAFIGKKTAGE